MPLNSGRVPLASIFRVFFIIGATSFGGGLISWFHREIVTRRRWLTEEQFMSGVALGQVLPGPNVTNLAVYIGQRLRGPRGAAIALGAMLTGPFFLCIALAAVYSEAIRIPGFHAAMDGIAAAAIGMILRLGWMGASHSCRKAAPAVIALAVFIAIGILKWPLLAVVAVAAPLSVALVWPKRKPQGGGGDA